MKWVLTSDADLSVPLDQVLKWEDSMLMQKNKYILVLETMIQKLSRKISICFRAILNFLTKKNSQYKQGYSV